MNEEKPSSVLKTFWPLFLLIGGGIIALGFLSATGEGGNKEDDKDRVKLDSGLEYKILKEGDGEGAKPGDTVVVHYTGTLKSNGKKFDSSLDSGKPFEFDLGAGRVIKGWDEGVAGMKVGEKRKLFIPSELGYGVKGSGKSIPPNADLVFEVELLKIVK